MRRFEDGWDYHEITGSQLLQRLILRITGGRQISGQRCRTSRGIPADVRGRLAGSIQRNGEQAEPKHQEIKRTWTTHTACCSWNYRWQLGSMILAQATGKVCLLADTEGAENGTEQIIAAETADDLSQCLVRQAQVLGCKFTLA